MKGKMKQTKIIKIYSKLIHLYKINYKTEKKLTNLMHHRKVT